MRHLDPTRAIREMAARRDQNVDAAVRRFRHHSRRELDIRAPAGMKTARGSNSSWRATGSAGDPRPAYESARAQALAALPWHKRRSFVRKLDRLRRFVWLREEMRDLSTPTLLPHSTAHARARAAARARRRHFLHDLPGDPRRRPAKHRPEPGGVRELSQLQSAERNRRAVSIPADGWRRGPAGYRRESGGGHVASHGSPARSKRRRVEQGAILVCPFTDPGWTVTLDRVAGVVTETGGLLSHAAVICREYGIPAVLAIPRATERIRDGQHIVIDGGRGCVELVE